MAKLWLQPWDDATTTFLGSSRRSPMSNGYSSELPSNHHFILIPPWILNWIFLTVAILSSNHPMDIPHCSYSWLFFWILSHEFPPWIATVRWWLSFWHNPSYWCKKESHGWWAPMLAFWEPMDGSLPTEKVYSGMILCLYPSVKLLSDGYQTTIVTRYLLCIYIYIYTDIHVYMDYSVAGIFFGKAAW